MNRIVPLTISLILSCINCATYAQTNKSGSADDRRTFVCRPSRLSCVKIVDYSQCPDAKDVATNVMQMCDTSYSLIRSVLGLPENWGQNSVNVMLLTSDVPHGWTMGNTVQLSSNWFRQHPHDVRLVSYQLTYALEHYPRPRAGCFVPGWFCQALPNYVSAKMEPNNRAYTQCRTGDTYKGSASCATAFLLDLENKYSRARPVETAVHALTNCEYNDTIWQKTTGRSLEDLWDEFSAARGLASKEDVSKRLGEQILLKMSEPKTQAAPVRTK